jgi:serine/threonine protein kinase/tetratricopeptide (TPR) repeat protein
MSNAQLIPEIGGYKILNEISRGAMGIVYRVEKDGLNYALKLLKATDLENIFRFRKETASIARLNHDGLVKIIDANEVDGNHFIVLELLEGDTLAKVVSAGPMPFARFLTAACSLASALAEMHRYKMIHRDIKPANIIITNSGKIKLLDLGLAGDSTDLKETDQKTVVGTILYSSPEQCRVLKRPVDARSDLYSLGITLFECLTGDVPFKSENIAELMRMHAAVPAPDVRAKLPDASPALAAIIAKLVAKDPDDRYQSAQGLRFDLDQVAKLDEDLKSGRKVILGSRDALLGSSAELPLVGRKKEMARLNDYWRAALSRRGYSVIIEGEGGSGKSRLTQEVVNLATEDGALVLKGKCQLLASRIPFAAFREAFESMLMNIKHMSAQDKQLWFELIRGAAAGSVSSINELCSGFREILGESQKDNTGDQDSDRNRFLEDITQFVVKLANVLPGMVLLVDDVQWLDEASAEVIEQIGERAAKLNIFVLMTSRNDLESSSALSRFKARLLTTVEPSIELGPLTLEDVSDIIAAQIGTNSLHEDSIRRIAIATNGNPFVITEYIRGLLNSGDLSYMQGKWTINSDGIADVILSADVFRLVLNRIQSLNESTKLVLSFAAVIGNTFDIPSLIGSSGMSDETVINALQEAEENNLIVALERAKYRFAHDRIREAMTSDLAEAKLREINDSLARYTDQLAVAEKPWYDIARYYANGNLANHLKRGCEANQEAGKLALLNYAHQEAYGFFSLALQCGKQFNIASSQIAQIAKNMAAAGAASGHEEKAYEAIDLALSLVKDREEMVDCLYVKLGVYVAFGRFNHAWPAFKEVIALVDRPYCEYPFSKSIQTSWLMFVTVLKIITGFGFGKARKNAGKKKRIEELASIYLRANFVARFRSGDDYLLTALHQLNLTHQLGNTGHYARALGQITTFFFNKHYYSVGKALISLAKRVSEQTGDPTAKTLVRLYEMQGALASEDPKWIVIHGVLAVESAWNCEVNKRGARQRSIAKCPNAFPKDSGPRESVFHGQLSSRYVAVINSARKNR